MSFRYVSYNFDEQSGLTSFVYAFDSEVQFTETFRFPVPATPLPPDRHRALDRTLFLLSLAAGISYYKTRVPAVAIVESGEITQAELAWLQRLFFHGLGEFAFVNQLDLRGRPQFQCRFREPEEPPKLGLAQGLAHRNLVAVGGGKDSCVSIETLRQGGEEILLASVNQPRPIVEVMAAAELPFVHVERSLSPELFRLNKQGAYNGHVPVTAIVSLALVATAILTDCDAVVLSNERSASVGNVEHTGTLVNHQYSKSLAAERDLAALLRMSVAPDLCYFSLLRPLSELEIARRFSTMTRYHQVFTSCNKAFRIDTARRIERWCGDCPKCRFVFLALAPHLSPKELTRIVGHDLLDDPSQFAGFDALIGWQTHKPFECVGEVEESVAALLLLGAQPSWKHHAVVRRFHAELLPQITLPGDILEAPFINSTDHDLPAHYEKMLHALD